MQLREVFKALKTKAAEGIISVVNREIQRKVGREFVQRRDLEQGKGRGLGQWTEKWQQVQTCKSHQGC